MLFLTPNQQRQSTEGNKKIKIKLEPKDILPKTNCMQAAETAEKCRFCRW